MFVDRAEDQLFDFGGGHAVKLGGPEDSVKTTARDYSPRVDIETARRRIIGTQQNKTSPFTSPSTGAGRPLAHSLNDKELISTHIARVDVRRDHLAIQLSAKSERARASDKNQLQGRQAGIVLDSMRHP